MSFVGDHFWYVTCGKTVSGSPFSFALLSPYSEDDSPQNEVYHVPGFSGNNRSFCRRDCGGAPEWDTVASLGQVEDCQ
jgi:hypothetical protein